MKDEKDFHIEALTAKVEELRNALACEMDDTSNACGALNNEIERLQQKLAQALAERDALMQGVGGREDILRRELAEARGLLQEAVGDIVAYEVELDMAEHEEGLTELRERVSRLADRMLDFLKAGNHSAGRD